jgi:ubiquinone/menaquinone biosynthesis C-methylase UbiE
MIKENIDAVSYYNVIAKSYDVLYREEQEKKLNLAKTLLKFKKEDLLLDVGCGSGFSSKLPCKVYGIDPSIELIKLAIAKKLENTEFKVGYAEKLPFPDKYFTKLVSLTAIQNFNCISTALDEFLRVLKDDSRGVISILKRSPKFDLTAQEIKKRFKILKEINEDKDIFFFIHKL